VKSVPRWVLVAMVLTSALVVALWPRLSPPAAPASAPASRAATQLGGPAQPATDPPVVPLSYLVSTDGRISQVNPPEVLRTPEQVRAVVARYLGPGAAG
jgi:hypothetical protein